MIPVTKTYLPPLEEYEEYLEEIWESGWITNNAQFSQLLEEKLEDYLDVPDVQLVSSGTIALQIALRVLALEGEVITTPFSYVATTSSIMWGNCEPVYVDINRDTLNIDPEQIEEAITTETSAILATHVFGVPCDVEAIEQITEKHDLTVIYDAAHAFGVKYKGESLLNYGDVSTLSFHATKLFHTAEGGAVVTKDAELAEKIFLSKTFGHRGNDHFQLGINGKNSELHAALGLCILSKVKDNIKSRKRVYDLYMQYLDWNRLKFPNIPEGTDYNYSYFPVIFEDNQLMKKVKHELEKEEVNARRYFYPSLNNLGYLDKAANECPTSVDISSKILCLPIYESLDDSDVERIATTVNKTIG